ncbi:MAG: hypothetical protein NC037_05085, partial [Bacteroides sp.]|nr:hypothetical protein [Bacteroides sp.]
MKDFILVFKVLFRNQNARRISASGKRKLPQNVVTLLCMLPLALLMCVVFGLLAVIVPDAKTLSLVSNVVVSAVQLFALFTSMFTVMNTLYHSSDTPFLNTLPISHISVFFAKFSIAYLNMLLFIASFTVPTLLTVSIVYAAFGRAMFYGYFALIFLITIVAPILPLFILTLFSMPISYIGSFFKGKSVLKTILALLFYVAIMVGYLLLVYYLGKDDDSELDNIQMTGSALAGLGVFAKVMYPNAVLIEFCLGIDAGKNFGISVGITVGMIVVMLLLAMLFYRRINQRRLETNNDCSHSAVSYKQSNSLVLSLMKKDFKDIMRNPSLAASSLATILMCPVISAIMYFVSDMQTSNDAVPEYLNAILKLSYLVLYSLIFLAGTNGMAMIAYTREGHSFYLTKTLPISAKDSIRAKFALSIIPSGIILIVQTIIAIALYRLDVLSVILFLICMAFAIVGATALLIYCDMR